MRHTFYEDGVVGVEIELVEDVPFIHVNVKLWTKEVYKHLLEVFVAIKDCFDALDQSFIYAMIDEEDNKLQHFASMFGFMPMEQVTGDNPMYRYWRG